VGRAFVSLVGRWCQRCPPLASPWTAGDLGGSLRLQTAQCSIAFGRAPASATCLTPSRDLARCSRLLDEALGALRSLWALGRPTWVGPPIGPMAHGAGAGRNQRLRDAYNRLPAGARRGGPRPIPGGSPWDPCELRVIKAGNGRPGALAGHLPEYPARCYSLMV
jgi:hypothetical protein